MCRFGSVCRFQRGVQVSVCRSLCAGLVVRVVQSGAVCGMHGACGSRFVCGIRSVCRLGPIRRFSGVFCVQVRVCKTGRGLWGGRWSSASVRVWVGSACRFCCVSARFCARVLVLCAGSVLYAGFRMQVAVCRLLYAGFSVACRMGKSRRRVCPVRAAGVCGGWGVCLRVTASIRLSGYVNTARSAWVLRGMQDLS